MVARMKAALNAQSPHLETSKRQHITITKSKKLKDMAAKLQGALAGGPQTSLENLINVAKSKTAAEKEPKRSTSAFAAMQAKLSAALHGGSPEIELNPSDDVASAAASLSERIQGAAANIMGAATGALQFIGFIPPPPPPPPPNLQTGMYKVTKGDVSGALNEIEQNQSQDISSVVSKNTRKKLNTGDTEAALAELQRERQKTAMMGSLMDEIARKKLRKVEIAPSKSLSTSTIASSMNNVLNNIRRLKPNSPQITDDEGGDDDDEDEFERDVRPPSTEKIIVGLSQGESVETIRVNTAKISASVANLKSAEQMLKAAAAAAAKTQQETKQPTNEVPHWKRVPPNMVSYMIYDPRTRQSSERWISINESRLPKGAIATEEWVKEHGPVPEARQDHSSLEQIMQTQMRMRRQYLEDDDEEEDEAVGERSGHGRSPPSIVEDNSAESTISAILNKFCTHIGRGIAALTAYISIYTHTPLPIHLPHTIYIICIHFDRFGRNGNVRGRSR